MVRLCGHLRFLAAFGVLLALGATDARAGMIELIINVSGQPTITITPGSALDTSGGANPDLITVNTGLLNTILAGGGSDLTFSALGAKSNNPGAATASITQTGEASTTGADRLQLARGCQGSAGKLGFGHVYQHDRRRFDDVQELVRWHEHGRDDDWIAPSGVSVIWSGRPRRFRERGWDDANPLCDSFRVGERDQREFGGKRHQPD
jgi:hypothetical protein